MMVAMRFCKLIAISAWCAEKCTAALVAQGLPLHAPEVAQMIEVKSHPDKWQRKRENREALIKLCWVVAPVAALAVVVWMLN